MNLFMWGKIYIKNKKLYVVVVVSLHKMLNVFCFSIYTLSLKFKYRYILLYI